jgi:signal transduction histidine kinase
MPSSGSRAARPEGPFGQIDQRDFASVLGRELRPAFVPILGVARLMRQAETASVETVNGYGEVIHAEATKAAEILDTILDYYAAESGAIQLNHAQVNVDDLVQRVVEVFRQIADAHRIHLRVACPSDLPEIACDPQRISQAFAHLLSNAIRFSGTQARVEVSAGVQHGIVEIRVADRGDGLSPEEAKLAFLPFKRDVKAGAKPQQGIGLGLTVGCGLRSFMAATCMLSLASAAAPMPI